MGIDVLKYVHTDSKLYIVHSCSFTQVSGIADQERGKAK
jgi:hypothetical protein